MTEADSLRKRHSLLATIVVLGLAVRIVSVVVWQDNLGQDRDAYLVLAAGLTEGRGYSSPGTTEPTAYRPPLYPMLLALGKGVDLEVYVAALHVLLGTATVALTFLLARRLNLSTPGAALAAGIVAFDPLLLKYTSFPMTETLSTFLTTALLLWTIRLRQAENHPSNTMLLFAGLLFGLNVLCRPTLWVFGGLMTVSWLFGIVLQKRRQAVTRDNAPPSSRRLMQASLIAMGILVCVLPWTLRNWSRLGHPIVTTTHGGYTLLLGNNPAFYREVVEHPLGTVWDASRGPGQAVWVNSINLEMNRLGIESEVERDRLLARRARSNIADQPGLFVRACLLRLVRFWNILPSGAAAEGVPSPLRWAIGGFYTLILASAAGGALLCLRRRDSRMVPLLLLVVSFMLVHVVYWSNVRMRAPVMPAVAILAASAYFGSRAAQSIARNDSAR